jgi:hypothetical protein
MKPLLGILVLLTIPFSFISAQNNGDKILTAEKALAGGTVFGVIETEYQEGVKNVEVSLSGNQTFTYLTLADGSYIFQDVPVEPGYSLAPFKNDNPLNGISVYDIVLISKHILGVQKLDSPYKLIAADINSSGTITVADLIEIMNLILVNVNSFPNNTSWRFIPANYVFPDPTNPWIPGLPEVININGTDWETIEQNYTGIKIGDVNGSAIPN